MDASVDTPVGPLTKLALWPTCDLFACGILQAGQLEAIFLGGIRKKPGGTSNLFLMYHLHLRLEIREEADGTVHPRDFYAALNF